MDVIEMKDLMPDMFTTSIRGREAFRRHAYSIEHNFTFDGRSVVTLPVVVQTYNIRSILFDVSRLLINITFFAFYVTFCHGYYFH